MDAIKDIIRTAGFVRTEEDFNETRFVKQQTGTDTHLHVVLSVQQHQQTTIHIYTTVGLKGIPVDGDTDYAISMTRYTPELVKNILNSIGI